MFMGQSSNKLRLALTCFALALLAVQLKCEDEHHEKIFEKELNDLFSGADDLKKEITNYIERVPSSHQSRSVASRILGDVKGKDKKGTQLGQKPRNKIKRVIAIIFRLKPKICDPSQCGVCPKVPDCVPCPTQECNECPVCPLPDYCKPPVPGQKCPPEPECPVCASDKTTTFRPMVPSSSSKPETTMLPTLAPNATTTATPTTTTTTSTTTTTTTTTTTSAPTTTTSKAPTTTTAKATTTTVAATTKRPSSKRRSRTRSTTTTAVPKSSTTKKANATQNDDIPPELLREMEMFIIAEQEGVGNDSSAKSIVTITTTTAMPKGESTDEFIENISNSMKIKKDSKSKTVTRTKTSFSNGSYTETETETSTESSITGSYLFEKNLNMLVSNNTMRDHIRKMLDMIPERAGGDELKMATKLLARFGEKKKTTLKIKGTNRMLTHMHARRNIKEVLGYLLDRFRRRKCKCEPCPLAQVCSCPTKKPCPVKMPPKCQPCPENPQCPVPDGCKAYPPCNKCQDEGADNDGDPKLLDEVDLENPIKDGELKKVQKCKGFTCKFEDKCGVADLNPLTPKNSQSGYMNGGEDEVYGEWPSFVRLEISDEKHDLKNALCGGVLISDRHVLTAGHCVPKTERSVNIKPEHIKVHLADHEKEKNDKFEKVVNVKSICRSTKFKRTDEGGSRYDFTILELAETVEFNDHIQPACLPYKPVQLKKSTKCFVIGLGIMKYDPTNFEHKFARIVQKMPVKRTSCRQWGVRHDDRSRHCFTKAVGKGDSCTGDSGGPILCINPNNRWTVMGIVSYGSEACDGSESMGWVGVYTRVQALLNQMNMDCKI